MTCIIAIIMHNGPIIRYYLMVRSCFLLPSLPLRWSERSQPDLAQLICWYLSCWFVLVGSIGPSSQVFIRQVLWRVWDSGLMLAMLYPFFASGLKLNTRAYVYAFGSVPRDGRKRLAHPSEQLANHAWS